MAAVLKKSKFPVPESVREPEAALTVFLNICYYIFCSGRLIEAVEEEIA